MSQFCPNCGNQLDGGAAFCPKCGAKTGAANIASAAVSAASSGVLKISKKKLIIIASSVGAAILATVLILVFTLSGDKKAGGSYEGEWHGEKTASVSRNDVTYELKLKLYNSNKGTFTAIISTGDTPEYVYFDASVEDGMLKLVCKGYKKNGTGEMKDGGIAGETMSVTVRVNGDTLTLGSYDGNSFYQEITRMFPATLNRMS